MASNSQCSWDLCPTHVLDLGGCVSLGRSRLGWSKRDLLSKLGVHNRFTCRMPVFLLLSWVGVAHYVLGCFLGGQKSGDCLDTKSPVIRVDHLLYCSYFPAPAFQGPKQTVAQPPAPIRMMVDHTGIIPSAAPVTLHLPACRRGHLVPSASAGARAPLSNFISRASRPHGMMRIFSRIGLSCVSHQTGTHAGGPKSARR